MKKIAALLYIFIFIFASCEEEVEYEDLGVKNMIVINGRFIDGETPWCQVSRSDIIFDQINKRITPTTFLPNANVTVSDGSTDFKYVVVADSAMMEADGMKAKAGMTYTLKANAKGLDDVNSTVTVPSKPQVDFRVVSVESSEDNRRYKINYELNIQDDPNTEDYYQIVIYAKYPHYKYEYGVIDTVDGYWFNDEWIEDHYEIYGYYVVDSSIVYDEINTIMQTDDPVMNWNQSESDNNLFEISEDNEMNIFNDQLFNGQTSKIRFYMDLLKGGEVQFIDISSIEYEVRHINKEMYMYYRTYQMVRDNSWSGSLSPYMLYCNVENGAGLIAAWSAIKKPLPSPELSKEDNDFNNIP